MSGAATIAITVGIAVAVLVGFFVVYYLGNVANSIYDIKVGVRKDFDKKVKELQDFVDSEMKQRINWMREENKEEMKRLRTSLEDNNEETLGELGKAVERLRQDVTSLQVESARAGERKPEERNDAPRKPAPSVEPALGADLEVSRTGMPESEPAPDLAMPTKAPSMPELSVDETLKAAEQKPALAGKASVEQKVRKTKKRRKPDEFEAFTQFKSKK